MPSLKLPSRCRRSLLLHQLILPLIREDPEVTNIEDRETTEAEVVTDSRRVRTVLVITVVSKDTGLVSVQYRRLQVRHRHPHRSHHHRHPHQQVELRPWITHLIEVGSRLNSKMNPSGV